MNLLNSNLRICLDFLKGVKTGWYDGTIYNVYRCIMRSGKIVQGVRKILRGDLSQPVCE